MKTVCRTAPNASAELPPFLNRFNMGLIVKSDAETTNLMAATIPFPSALMEDKIILPEDCEKKDPEDLTNFTVELQDLTTLVLAAVHLASNTEAKDSVRARPKDPKPAIMATSKKDC